MAGGRKKALLIGCNYPGQNGELTGCCTDVTNLALIVANSGYSEITLLVDDFAPLRGLFEGTCDEEDEWSGDDEDQAENDEAADGEDDGTAAPGDGVHDTGAGELFMEALREQVEEDHDDGQDPRVTVVDMETVAPDGRPLLYRIGPPTRQFILESMDWLVLDAQAGDKLWFSYSGHGSSGVDTTGTERDGQMEYFCPTDGVLISDDVVNKRLISPIPRGVTLHCFIDACHSGTILDLPYAMQGDIFRPKWVQVDDPRTKGCAGLVVQFSSCCDSQVSSDQGVEVGGLGTCTFTLALAALGPDATYARVFEEMKLKAKQVAAQRDLRQRHYKQVSMKDKAMKMVDGALAVAHRGWGGRMLAQMAQKYRTYDQPQQPQLCASEPIDVHAPFEL